MPSAAFCVRSRRRTIDGFLSRGGEIWKHGQRGSGLNGARVARACHARSPSPGPRAAAPEAPKRVQPGVDLGQRARVDCVDAPGAFGAHRPNPLSRNTFSCCETADWGMPNSREMTSTTSPEACSPSARTSRIRRRTGSPRTSKACIRSPCRTRWFVPPARAPLRDSLPTRRAPRPTLRRTCG